MSDSKNITRELKQNTAETFVCSHIRAANATRGEASDDGASPEAESQFDGNAGHELKKSLNCSDHSAKHRGVDGILTWRTGL